MDTNLGATERTPVLGFGGTACGLMGAGMLSSYNTESMVSVLKTFCFQRS